MGGYIPGLSYPAFRSARARQPPRGWSRRHGLELLRDLYPRRYRAAAADGRRDLRGHYSNGRRSMSLSVADRGDRQSGRAAGAGVSFVSGARITLKNNYKKIGRAWGRERGGGEGVTQGVALQ